MNRWLSGPWQVLELGLPSNLSEMLEVSALGKHGVSSLCLCLEAKTVQKHKGEKAVVVEPVDGSSQPGFHVLLLEICSHSSIAVLCGE